MLQNGASEAVSFAKTRRDKLAANNPRVAVVAGATGTKWKKTNGGNK
jgi:hypothetical protein